MKTSTRLKIKILAFDRAIHSMVIFSCLLVTLLNTSVSYAQSNTTTEDRLKLEERVRKNLKETAQTIRFLENKGQIPNPEVLYYFESEHGSVYIERDRIRFVAVNDTLVSESSLKKDDDDEDSPSEVASEEGEMKTMVTATHTFSIYMNGSNPIHNIKLGDSFSTTFNYFLGNDPKNWASGVKAAKDLTLEDIYPGINLRLYSNSDGSMEFDWILEPGADYKKVQLQFKGEDNVSIQDDGSLDVGLRFTNVKFNIPESYQVNEQGKIPVNMSFTKANDNTITFTSNSKLDPSLPVIIDPTLKWGTFVDANNANFDAYLFAIQVDPVSGIVYCAGGSNQNFPTGAAPYDANGYLNTITFNNQSQGATALPTAAVVYRISNDGTDLIDYTLYGPATMNGNNGDNVVAQALSLSTNNVMIGGVTSGVTLPTLGAPAPFDNTPNSGDGFVAIFTKDLGTLNYATYLGGTGNENIGVTSIRALSDNSYVVGMTVLAALPATYITAGVADATFAGASEMYIAKFTTNNVLTWGTYVGGANDETFNDLEVFGDGRVAFCGYGNGTITEVNGAATATSSAATGNTDGIVGVLNSTATAFNYLDKIGGAGDDRINDVEIVSDTLYWCGSASTGFPVSASGVYDISENGGLDGVIGKVYSGGTTGYKATYYGSPAADLSNGIRLVNVTACNGTTTTFLLVFGTVGGTGLPTVNINGETFYNPNYTAGGNSGLDMYFAGFTSNLQTLIYATYMGGNQDDYLGATGVPRGANHLWVNGADCFLGTTTHSASLTPTLLSGGFDLSKTNGTNDSHLVLGITFPALVQTDYGDAPATYGAPSHTINCTTLKMGPNLDAELASAPTTLANGDDLAGIDDEDAISTLPSFADGGPQTITVNVDNISNSSGLTANLYGWIDLNGDGAFQLGEIATNTIVTGSVNVTRTLTWTGVTITGAAANSHYLRIRLTTDALADLPGTAALDERSTAAAGNGEVEDYRAIDLTCPVTTTTAPCLTQAAINTAYTNWLATAKAGGGCNDGVLGNNSTGAPLACGGSTTVTFTYTSSCAPVSTTCMSTFTVPTNTAPVIVTCAATRTIEGCSTAAITTPPFSAVSAASTEAVFESAPNNGNTSDNCAITAVTYIDATSGTCPIVVTRKWTVTDACGSSTTCNQTINVNDTTNPVITACAVTRTIEGCNTGAITSPPFSAVTAASTEAVFESAPNNGNTSDACGITSVTYIDVAAGTCPTVVTRKWTVSDACGHSSTCNQTINVNDTTNPVIVSCAATRTIEGCNTAVITSPPFSAVSAASSEAVFESAPNNGNTSDACGITTVTYIDVAAGTCPTVVTRKWTVTDACGHSSTCNQTINVNDTTSPVIIACAANRTIEGCNTGAILTPPFSAVTAASTEAVFESAPNNGNTSDACGITSVTYIDMAAGLCPTVVTRKWTVTDACGHSATCNQTISVNDTTSPTITANAVTRTVFGCDPTVITDPPYSPTVAVSTNTVFEDPTNQGVDSDACGITSVTYIDVAMGVFPIIVTRTWTISDACGHSAVSVQAVNVMDGTPPVITTCAGTRNIEGCNTGAITNPPFSATLAASTEAVFEGAPNNGNTSDDCGITAVAYIDVATGTCPTVVTRKWTVSDASGHSASCTQTINVNDTTSPVITACAATRTIEGCNTGAITSPPFSTTLAASTEVEFESAPNNGNTSDACGIVSVSYIDVAAGTCPTVVTRKWTVSDACGHSSTCNQTINVNDTTPPVISACAATRTIEGCNTGAITSPPFSATLAASTEVEFESAPNNGNTSDACGIVSVTYIDVAAGTCPTVVTRKWTVSDACGHSSTCNQTINVNDTTAPTITACAVTRTIEGCNPSVITSPPFSATIAASTEVVFESAPNNGNTSDACGITTVTYIDVAAGTCPTVVTRKWTVTDACGHSSTCNQTINVNDTTSPVISACAVPRTIQGCNTGAITDPPFSPTGDVSSEAVFEDATNLGNTSDACGITSVTYIDLAFGTCPIQVTRKWTVSDACGHSSTCNQSINIFDTTAPSVVACAVTRTIEGCNTGVITDPPFATTSTASSEAVFEDGTNQGNISDACGITTVTYIDVATGTCPTVVTRKWTISDACGNSSTCNQTINVNDTTAPTITACAVTRTLEGCGLGSITDPPYSATSAASSEGVFEDATNQGNASDACGITAVTYIDVSSGTCPMVVTRKWTVSDACGHSSTCNQTINVDDNTNPTFTLCPANLVLGCVAGTDNVALINAWIATATATDACDASVAITTNYDGTSVPSFSCEGGMNITFTATDDCGNSASCISTVTKPCFSVETYVYIEGAAVNPNGSNSYTLPMRTTLNNLRVLPGQTLFDPFLGNKYTPPGQPYSGAPWNYPGTEGNAYDSGGDPNMGTAGYPATVVDWILVSLRLDSAGTGGPVCQAAALLHSDGHIEFVQPLACCGVNENTPYYITIEHRNHLIVMSNAKVPWLSHKLSYDFRFQQSWEDPLFPTGTFARQKELIPGFPGKFGMYAGNGNQTISANSDTDINFDDRSFWETQNGQVGEYRVGDYNLNGDTNFNDRVVWERNNGKFTSVPRN